MRARLLVGFAVVLAAGCGSKKFAPVSGRVTLNGQPLANATVSFSPVAEGGRVEAGEGSTGKTNENGEFTLRSTKGKSGALVGKHRVSISALSPEVGESDERVPRGGWPLADKVPARYGVGGKDEIRFDVPDGGTDKANFDLTAP